MTELDKKKCQDLIEYLNQDIEVDATVDRDNHDLQSVTIYLGEENYTIEAEVDVTLQREEIATHRGELISSWSEVEIRAINNIVDFEGETFEIDSFTESVLIKKIEL